MQRHQFLQWIMHVSEPPQNCIENTRTIYRKFTLICQVRLINVTTCCKYAGSVNTTFIFSMVFITFDPKIAFRLRGVRAICANISFCYVSSMFILWIPTNIHKNQAGGDLDTDNTPTWPTWGNTGQHGYGATRGNTGNSTPFCKSCQMTIKPWRA